jgi:hypothetical protein
MLNAMIGIAEGISVTNPYVSTYVPSQNMRIEGFNSTWVQTGFMQFSCDHPLRNPVATVSCNTTLQGSVAYRGIFVSWCVYFFILVVYHVWIYSCSYRVNDLRYYLLLLKSVAFPFNRYYVSMGLVFSMVTLAVALAKIVPNPNANRPSNILAIIFAGLVNFLLLRPFMSNSTISLRAVDIDKLFPEQVIAERLPPGDQSSIFNLYGAFVSADRVINLLLYYNSIDMVNPDLNIFAKISDDPEAVKEFVRKLCGSHEASGKKSYSADSIRIGDNNELFSPVGIEDDDYKKSLLQS